MSTYLVADDGSVGAATPLEVLTAADYGGWLESQAANVRQWLTGVGFEAAAGNWTWLPGSAGPDRVVAVVDAFTPTCTGALPLALPDGSYRLTAPDGRAAFNCALGWGLGAYQFKRYRNQKRQPATLRSANAEAVNRQLEAIYLVRDLINTPTNDMLPDGLQAATTALGEQFGATCEAVVGDALLERNFPTIHAVGRASACAPRLLELTWGDPAHPKVTLIGKGVCFDSGGLDIKPAAGMRLMKKDMGGAAHALGLARLVMSEALPVRLRVLIPAVENAVSGNAYRPGDVITTRKGTTVEIDNTDAEGRLVLADALALATETDTDLIVDFATLTGAARTALGADVPAMFSNDDEVADAILDGARAVADPVWRLPLHRPYKELLDSKVADLANAAGSPYGGAIMAALFLESFIEPDSSRGSPGASSRGSPRAVPWVHFDLMGWNAADRPGRPQGGEAMGLRAVYAYLSRRFG